MLSTTLRLFARPTGEGGSGRNLFFGESTLLFIPLAPDGRCARTFLARGEGLLSDFLFSPPPVERSLRLTGEITSLRPVPTANILSANIYH